MRDAVRLPRTWLLSLLLLLVAAGASASPVATPPTAATASPPTPAAATVEVIAPADIPDRANADERLAQEVLREAHATDPIAQFEPRLLALAKSVNEQSELFNDKELNFLPVTQLESIERHWRFFSRVEQAWRAELKQATSQSLDRANQLNRRIAIWEATRTASSGEPLPAALQSRIAVVQAALDLASRALAVPIEKQVQLGQRGDTIELQIQSGRESIAAAIAYNDERLVRIDAPALWDADFGARDGLQARSIATGLAAEAQFARDYGRANHLSSSVYNLFALLLLPLLIWLRVLSKRLAGVDPGAMAAARVLQRPLASWLLLSVTGILVVEPEAPIILHQMALFLALVPVLRLLPPRVYEVLGPWPYVASGLYLLDLLGVIFASNALAHRVYLLALTVLALVLLLWLLRRARRELAARAAAYGADVPIESLAAKVVRDTGWIGVAILAVSALSNLLGNVSLAAMLTSGLLFSGYLGLVLYAGVNVLTAILRLLLAGSLASKSRHLMQYGPTLLRGATWFMRLVGAGGWLLITLNQFRVLRPMYKALSALLTHPFGFGKFSLDLGSVLSFVLSIVLSFWLAGTVRRVLRDDLMPNLSLPRGVGNSVASLSYYALLMLGLLVALAVAGFEISQLTLVIGALGVGIGLGLQDVVRNFVSGLILMFERPIQPGDVVEVTGTAGTVRDIGMRATTLTTFDGADVVVPNGTLLSEKLTNWTLSNLNRRMELPVGVAYGSDPNAVLALLLQVTQATPGVAEEPEPAVFFAGFGASSLDFKIRAWTNKYSDWMRTQSDLGLRVHAALNEAGIEIPFPQADLHLRSVAPELRGMLGSGDKSDAGDKPD